ncbi:putative lipoprotein [Hyphomonas polymorpha PS728]|uniref:Putative lipoprotein n=1 Tax=Hyphomonas polymorpha PS728 TaxID=1280954 RepID=A0A062V7R2_9PROT|nr:hypothetical protein [Hyphomonas polymorpha]KCZ98177.1 putative lipoprotein [Hyphomonas polymorpha PS728]
MKFQLLAALPLVALIACTPKAEAPGETAPVAEEAAVTAASLPTCADAEATSGGQLPQLTSCRLELGDGRNVVVSSTQMTDGEGTLRAELTGADGASLQVIEEAATGFYNYPFLEDLTGDGAADLMLPQLSGMVNISYALWIQGADGLFSRAGELGGFDITLGSDGLIAASGRSSAFEWETSYYSVENGALKEIAVVVTRADPEEGEPASDQPACEVIRSADGVDIAPFCQPAADAPTE